MKITIINGSHRESSQSLKVAGYIQKVFGAAPFEVETELLSLENNPFPLWDEGVWNGSEEWKVLLNPLNELLDSSDGFVIISPEWHGQVPSGLKNLLLLMGYDQVGHKPALIVTVSAGIGGSYPVAELRMNGSKNNRLCFLPEHIIVRNVGSVLNKDESKNDKDADAYIRERLFWGLGILEQYAIALKGVRSSGAIATDKFKNGM